MTPGIKTDTAIEVLVALSEARHALSGSKEHHELALRVAKAEGSLRGALMEALPQVVTITEPPRVVFDRILNGGDAGARAA